MQKLDILNYNHWNTVKSKESNWKSVKKKKKDKWKWSLVVSHKAWQSVSADFYQPGMQIYRFN